MSSHRPDRDATRAHWDRLARNYDIGKQRNDAYYSALKRCFDQAVPQSARGRVLEIGCGTGQVLASLRPLNGVGIDLSQNMIDIARRQFAHRSELTFAAMDAEAATGLGEFDAVICADVLEHVEDWRSILSVMVRLCRRDGGPEDGGRGGGGRGGVIAVSTPNPIWALPIWILEKLNLKMPEGPHAYVSGRFIASALRELGCTVISRRTHLILPMNLWGLGQRISSIAGAIPGLRQLGVIQLVVAQRR
jgi:SAM-dependent methyltransferase